VIIPADDEARLNEGSVASWRRQNAAIPRWRRQYRLPVAAAVVHPHAWRAVYARDRRCGGCGYQEHEREEKGEEASHVSHVYCVTAECAEAAGPAASLWARQHTGSSVRISSTTYAALSRRSDVFSTTI